MEKYNLSEMINGATKQKPSGGSECSSSTSESWRKIVKQFAAQTTFHGLGKAITERVITRRIFWTTVIGISLSLLIFMMVQQLMYLVSHPVVVNIEVLYNESLTFPSLTICNQNTFRKTAAHAKGFYSDITFAYSKGGIAQKDNPAGYTLKRNTKFLNIEAAPRTFDNITAEVCQSLCDHLYDGSCCTLVFVQESNTCYISGTEINMQTASLVRSPGADLYIRDKCSVRETINETFEERVGVMIVTTSNLQWQHVKVRSNTQFGIWVPTYDHTTLSADGHVILVSSQHSINDKAVFYTPYLNQNSEACLRFFYMIRKANLTITRTSGNGEISLWTMTSHDTSPYWEYGEVVLPEGYYQVQFQATNVGMESGVEVSLDDIEVLPNCQVTSTKRNCKHSVRGFGYSGDVKTSRSGSTCVPWWSDVTWHGWHFTEESEGSSCRNPDFDPRGPWCVTNRDTGRMEYCHIDMCDCEPKGGAFFCANGQCLSKALVCDGITDCADGSDEIDCHQSVSCGFLEDLCGYDLTGDWKFLNNGVQLESEGFGRSFMRSPSFRPLAAKACLELQIASLTSSLINIETYIAINDSPLSELLDERNIDQVTGTFPIEIDFKSITKHFQKFGLNESNNEYRYLIGVVAAPSDSLEITRIDYREGICQEIERPTLNEPRPADKDYSSNVLPIDIPRPTISCNFEEDYCGYKFLSSTSSAKWFREKYENRNQTDENHMFLGIKYNAHKGDWMRAVSPIAHIRQPSCLTISYKCSFADIVVSSYNTSGTVQLFNITNDGQQPVWHKVRRNIPVGYHGIVIQINYRMQHSALIGIDDVTLSDGYCLDQSSMGNLSCSFIDDDWCGYTDVSESEGTWFRGLDISFGTFYMRTGQFGREKIPRQLLSPVTSADDQQCMSFEYFVQAPSLDYFSKLSLTYMSLQNMSTFWWVSAIKDNVWHKAHITLPPGIFRLLFELNGDETRCGIRNIAVSPGSCSNYNIACDRDLDYKCFNNEYGYMACVSTKVTCDGVNNCLGAEDESRAAGCLSPSQNDSCGDITYMLPDYDIGERSSHSMEWLYTELGHQETDLIYRCEWLGVPCDQINQTFKHTMTDYGLCYTLNSDGSLKTAATGALSGLSLTINIQEYEYMEGKHLDAGIKIYLHNADEVADLKNLGIALSPGTHALVGIKLSEVVGLEQPWSNCGTKSLKYFDQYSYTACKMDYEIQSLYKKCQCREAHMPGDKTGNPPVCDIDTMFWCVLPNSHRSSVYDEQGKLSCPKSCLQKVYTPTMSNTMLSLSSMEEILVDEVKLQHEVNAAVRTSVRVSDQFVAEVARFSRLKVLFENLHQQLIEYNGLASFKEVFNTFANLYTRDMEVLFHHSKMFLNQLNNWYEIVVNQFINDLDNLKEVVESKCRIAMLMTIDKSIDRRAFENVRSGIDDKVTTCSDSFRIVKYYLDHPKEVFLPDFIGAQERFILDQVESLVNEQCKVRVESGFKDLLNATGAFLAIKSDSFTSHRSFLVKLASEITSYRDDIIKCMATYKPVLQNAISWNDRSKKLINPILMKMGNITDPINKLGPDHFQTEWLVYFMNVYEWDDYTQEYYDRFFDDLNKRSMELDMFRDDIKATFSRNYYDVMQELSELLKDEYRSALEIRTNVLPILSDIYYWELLNGMSIWKMPKPDFNKRSQYKDLGKELWWAWNPELNFTDFVYNKSAEVISEAVDGYFQPIFTLMKHFENSIIRYSNELEEGLRNAIATYQKQKQLMTIDEAFVKRNFLKIDIFYEELKYEKIEQVPAYGLTQFFSDIGGSMGLLIGGSVLSLVEMLDFFFYNGYLKLSGRHRRRKQRDKESEDDQFKESIASVDVSV